MSWIYHTYKDEFYAEPGRGYPQRSATSVSLLPQGVVEVEHDVVTGWDGSSSTETASVPLDVIIELLRRAGYTVTKTGDGK